MNFDFDEKSFFINGKRDFLCGGELAHFRVPKEEWRRRMRLFKQAGGNALTTSVAWSLHEPEEGKILFGDVWYRDLAAYLEVAKEENLLVYIRPGPLVYTELINGGIPDWLFDKYPQTQAKRADGTYIRQLSYLHPLAMEKYYKFYEKFAEVVKPHLLSNGGSVAMIQLDNELAGIHTWNGTLDYNEETMGFFKPDGRYVLYVENRYGDIKTLNAAYDSDYSDFCDIDPRKFADKAKNRTVAEKDYHDFYCRHLAVYAKTLFDKLRNSGVDCAVTANAANAYLLNYLKELSDEMKDEKFFIGFDSYYGLDLNWANFHPTLKWYMKNVYAADALESMGYPFSIVEMQLGSYADFPPVLPKDLEQWYRLNLALGMKGVSYYIFSGGATPEGQAMTADIYDFQAPVSADGKIRPTYKTLKKFNRFMTDNDWILNASRINSVQVGFEWQTMRGNDYAKYAGVSRTLGAEDDTIKCLAISLESSGYSYKYVRLDKKLDIGLPLVILSHDVMSRAAQQNVVDFVSRGGKLLILSALPRMDEDFTPCEILKDFIGVKEEDFNDRNPVALYHGQRIYYSFGDKSLSAVPPDAEVTATDGAGKTILGAKIKKGKGVVEYFCRRWLTKDFDQVAALELALSDLGAEICVERSNRYVYAKALSDGKTLGVFLMNLYTGELKTDAVAHYAGLAYKMKNVSLKAGEVKFFNFTIR